MYNSFLELVNDELEDMGYDVLCKGDNSTVVHCFGYGKSVTETVERVLFNRRVGVYDKVKGE